MKFMQLKSVLAVAAIVAATQAAAGPVGYGAAATGGGSASPVTVSSMAAMQAAIDAYSGSGGLVLNYTGTFDFTALAANPCAQHSKAAQIVEIKNKGNITIMGANGSAANFGIHIAGSASNIVVRNMTIGLLPGGDAADSISIEGMSSGVPSNIWVDHNTIFADLTMCSGAGDASFDGGIDMKKGAHNITISYNYVHHYQKVSLNGYSDSDTVNANARTTYHHNRFEEIKSRLPLQRFGLTHIYNNYFNQVHTSGINVRMGGQALIESNYFENTVNPVTSRDSSALGYWDLRNNYVGSGITWVASDSAPTKDATDWTTTKAFGSTGYSYTADAAACVKALVIATAGAGNGLKESNGSCTASSSSSAASSVAASSSSSAASSVATSSSSASKASSSAASSAASSSAASSASGAPVLSGTGDYPTGFSKCADLGGTCSVSSGTGWVAFGRKGSWVTKKVSVGGSIACTVAAFGSDAGGNPNKCSTQN